MKVILSIKPNFVRMIFNREKLYEYRKTLFKSNVKTVLIYASAPVKRIVGEFEIDYILSDEIEVIWYKTHEYSGISRKYYQSYFHNRKKANAIRIGSITIYDNFKCLSDYNIKHAPQSFCYVDESEH